MDKLKLIISSAYAAIITIVFIVIITVWTELSAPLKDWLKNFSGHHWISKSILSALLYAIAVITLYLAPQRHSDDRLKRTLNYLLIFTIFGIIIITLFFAGHYFKII